MKVRASVKKICRNCKIIRRNGRCASDLHRRTAQAASGLIREETTVVARIAGINIPLTKHVVIALTSIYGIGDTRARRFARPRVSSAGHAG